MNKQIKLAPDQNYYIELSKLREQGYSVKYDKESRTIEILNTPSPLESLLGFTLEQEQKDFITLFLYFSLEDELFQRQPVELKEKYIKKIMGAPDSFAPIYSQFFLLEKNLLINTKENTLYKYTKDKQIILCGDSSGIKEEYKKDYAEYDKSRKTLLYRYCQQWKPTNDVLMLYYGYNFHHIHRIIFNSFYYDILSNVFDDIAAKYDL